MEKPNIRYETGENAARVQRNRRRRPSKTVAKAPPPPPDTSLVGKLVGYYVSLRRLLALESDEEPAETGASATTAYTCAKTKIGKLLDDPSARAIVDKHIPGLSGRPQIGLARSMTLKQLQLYSPECSDPVLAKIDAEFAKLPPKK